MSVLNCTASHIYTLDILQCLDYTNDQVLWGEVYSFHPFDILHNSDPVQEVGLSNSERPKVSGSSRGIHAKETGISKFEFLRVSKGFVEYIPSLFGRKLRSVDQFSEREVISNPIDFFNIGRATKIEVESITFVCLDRVCFTPTQRSELSLILARLLKLEVLIIRSSNINRVQDIRCDYAMYIDLSFNELSELHGILQMLSYCKRLFHADFSGNSFLSREENCEEAIISACPPIRFLNKKAVDIRRKVTAISRFGDSAARSKIGFEIWDNSVCNNLAYLGIKEFDAALIHELDLRENGLVMVHLGLFSHLSRLNLSSNYIQKLQGTGMEQLECLRSLQITKNLIADPDELEPFNALPDITWLSMSPQRDPDTLTTYAGYRNLVIMLTIDSCGSEARPGLNFLDQDDGQRWIEVTIDERLSALKALNRLGHDELESERWNLSLIQSFGHSKINQTRYLEEISNLTLSGCSLRVAELLNLPNITHLDLSENKLHLVLGLEFLNHLEHLNLSRNDPLVTDCNSMKLMNQIQHATSLKSLYLPFDTSFEFTPGAFSEKKNENLAYHLIATNPLKYLNGRKITIYDRVAVFKKSGKTAAEVERYMANLVLISSAAHNQTTASEFVLPTDVEPSVHYEPTAVVELPDIHSFGLTSRALREALPAFTNLIRLNLAHNRLNTLKDLGFESMRRLAVLDVTFNLLADPLISVADILDSLHSIQFAAFRGNPNYKTPADRLRLIGHMKIMQESEHSSCSLRYLDSEITISERIQAWIQAGLPKEHVERMRYRAMLRLCAPANIKPEEILELDLNFRNIQVLVAEELLKFRFLNRLHIQSNGLLDISCISALTCLVLLDFRENHISEVCQVVEVVKNLSNLIELGAEDNGFVGPSLADEVAYGVFRRNLLSQILPFGLCTVGFHLRYLDDREVKISEIADASIASKAEKQRFAFDESIFRALQAQGTSDWDGAMLVERAHTICISGLNLEYIDFSSMISLTSVDVSCNDLVDFAIAQGGFFLLTCLKVLDVSSNRIQSDDCLADIVRFGQDKSLISITVHSNPFFPTEDGQQDRIRFLSCIESALCVGATLKYMNGRRISVDERCEAARYRALYSSGDKIDIDNLKLSLLIEESGCNRMTTTLRLATKGLRLLACLSNYVYLESLDLRCNRICELSPLLALPRLETLDLRENEVSEMDQVLQVLRRCDSLRDIWLEHVSLDWGKWNREHPFFWRDTMRLLPALLSCDGNMNPAPLASFQWVAVCNIKRRFDVGPNSIVTLDLREKRIGKEEFYAVRDWIAFLPVTELNIDDNPFCRDIPIYRFILINDLKTLTTLNGSQITEVERAAAFKRVDQMKRDFAYYYPNLDSLKMDNHAKSASCASKLQGSYNGSSSAVSSWGSQVESFMGYIQVQVLVISMPGIQWDSMPLYKEIRSALQPIVLDWDLLLPELQVDSSYSVFIWLVFLQCDCMQCLCCWGYFKSIFFIVLPLVLWHSSRFGMDVDRWEQMVLQRFGQALACRFLVCALLCLLSVVLAVAWDCLDCHQGLSEISSASELFGGSNQTTSPTLCLGNATPGKCESFRRIMRGQGLLPGTQALVTAAVSLCSAWFLLWTLVACVARHESLGDCSVGFWFTLSKAKRKACLLLLVVSYLPVSRVLLDNVLPVDSLVNASTPVAKWVFPSPTCSVSNGVAAQECPDYPSTAAWFLQPGHAIFLVRGDGGYC